MITPLLGAAYVVLLVCKVVLAIRAAQREPKPGRSDFSDVVIAQPILSGDPGLSDTLEDNLRTLGAAHFLWIIDVDDPAAHAICGVLIGRHPDAHIEVLVAPPPPDGCNPKLFKLEMARARVHHHVLVVLDDDTRLPAASLAALLAALEQSDVATGLPAYLDDGRWPSRLLAQFVNNNAALTYLPLLNVWPPLTINGMAYAMRSERLNDLGGFAPLMGYLTDDLAVARLVLSAGGRIAQTALPQWVQTTVTDGNHYMRVMHRWFLFAWLLMRHQPGRVRAVIALLHALPAVLLWSIVIAAIVEQSFQMLIGLVVLRAFILIALQQRIYGRPLHKPLSSLASELLQPVHLLHATFSRTIVWRTRHYDVLGDDSFHSVS